MSHPCDKSPIPEFYGQTCVVLLPRDPHWIFSYWEVTDFSAQEIKSIHGNDIFSRSQAALRAHQSESAHFFDIDVTLNAKNWYLRTDREGASWFVELGLKTPEGQFIVLAKSNVITLPVARVSGVLDEKWVLMCPPLPAPRLRHVILRRGRQAPLWNRRVLRRLSAVP